MDYLRARHVAAVLAILATAHGIRAGTSAVPDAYTLLRQYIRTTSAEVRRLDRGEPVTRSLQSSDTAEMTSVGVVRVRCSPDRFLERVRDIERFKASEYLLQIGRFSSPPSLDDVAKLEMDAGDRRDLRGCRPGKCELRLPAGDMIAMRDAVPWATAGEAAAANDALRRFVVQEATTYVSGGSRALGDYADQQVPVRRAAAFADLLHVSAFKAEYQPAVFAFLDQFPAVDAAGIESVLVWSRERFGLKPVTNITHTAIRRDGDEIVFASKMVYTNHYLDSSLGMSVYIPAPGSEYAYVTYMNRSKAGALKGAIGAVARAVASSRSRDALAKTLLDVRKKLER